MRFTHREPERSTVADRPGWVDPAHFPFTSRYLDVAGCRLHYVDEGDGPVLLLLHGNPTWSFLYRHLIPALRDEFRCIALDYPGFGLSTAPPGYGSTPEEHAGVVAGFVEHLDLSGYVPFLHDWGGPIGLSVAARAPERVAGLVIGNTFAWPVTGVWHFEWFSRLFGGALGRVGIRYGNAFVNLLLRAGTRRRRLSRAEMAHYRRALPTPRAREVTWVLPRAMRASEAFLAEVDAGLSGLAHLPALIVWGEADIAFREAERRRFQDVFGRHRVVELAGAGHYIQEDAPDEIAAAVRTWWGDHQPRPDR